MAFRQEVTNSLPGIGATIQAGYRKVWKTITGVQYAAGANGKIDGNKARDPLNVGYEDTLQCGLLLGKVTSGHAYAPAILGLTTSALTTVATTLAVSVATAVEIVRRIGSSGTLTLVGPPAASGTVASQTVTFSAVNTSTGAITITATGTASVTASLVMPTDGTQVIRTFVDKEDGIHVALGGVGQVVEFPRIPVGGQVDVTGIVNYPADSSLQAWVKAALNTNCDFIFSDAV